MPIGIRRPPLIQPPRKGVTPQKRSKKCRKCGEEFYDDPKQQYCYKHRLQE